MMMIFSAKCLQLILLVCWSGSFSEVIPEIDWQSELVRWRFCIGACAQELSAAVRLHTPLPVMCQHRHTSLPEVERIWWQNVVRELLRIALWDTLLHSVTTPFDPGCLLTSVWWCSPKEHAQMKDGTFCWRNTWSLSRLQRRGWSKRLCPTVL